MATNKQDALARAFAKLSSLRKNIDKMTASRVPETYVREFHTVLGRLEGIGIGVSEFRIPDSEITPTVTVIETLTFANRPRGTRYSKEKYVDKSFILTQLDAILGYLQNMTSDKPGKMGYIK